MVRYGHDDRKRPVFISLALPGERVLAQPRADTGEGVACQLSEIIEASPARIDPVCPHYGACGGCGLQHWAEAPYRIWKRERVVTALKRAGVEAGTVSPLVPADPHSRRRADFVMRRLSGGVVLGFHERGGNRIVDITECAVLTPSLVRLAGDLRKAGNDLLSSGESARAQVNELDSGLDLLLTLPGEPDLAALQTLAALAETADLCRLSTRSADAGPQIPPVPVLERRRPVIRFSSIEVGPPPGAFLQATETGSREIVAAVLKGVESASRILELYSGCGTLSFPLLAQAKVRAVEADPAATAAMISAAGQAKLQGVLEVETRDLVNNPIKPSEMTEFDAIVFDPPRAGARAQAEAIGAGGPDQVVAVSCNPATFARDARILVDAGYSLDQVVPIDQFLWSPHVELVACFQRSGGT